VLAQGGTNPPSPWSNATVEQLTAGAQKGDPAAAYALGLKYWLGEGVRKDVKAAIVWFSRAAAKSYPSADAALGVIYEEGDGIEADDRQAGYFYRRGAEGGDALSQYRLGLFLTKGRGVERNYSEAARWYKAAADQGFAEAANNLGYLYATGQGVPQDLQAAQAWYEKAAAAGSAAATENLAKLKASANTSVAPQAPAQDLNSSTKAPRIGATALSLSPDQVWTGLARMNIQPANLPEGFMAPRREELASTDASDGRSHELKINLSHATGPHWFGYRTYPTIESARAAYADFEAHIRNALPTTTRYRIFSLSRLIGSRPYIFKCVQSFPAADTSAHTVQCLYDEPKLPVVFAAGTAARYGDAEYPPDAVWRRVTDLLAFAYLKSQEALSASADKF